MTGQSERVYTEHAKAAQRRVRALLDAVLPTMKVVEALDFTQWLVEYSQRIAGDVLEEAGKAD